MGVQCYICVNCHVTVTARSARPPHTHAEIDIRSWQIINQYHISSHLLQLVTKCHHDLLSYDLNKWCLCVIRLWSCVIRVWSCVIRLWSCVFFVECVLWYLHTVNYLSLWSVCQLCTVYLWSLYDLCVICMWSLCCVIFVQNFVWSSVMYYVWFCVISIWFACDSYSVIICTMIIC